MVTFLKDICKNFALNRDGKFEENKCIIGYIESQLLFCLFVLFPFVVAVAVVLLSELEIGLLSDFKVRILSAKIAKRVSTVRGNSHCRIIAGLTGVC